MMERFISIYLDMKNQTTYLNATQIRVFFIPFLYKENDIQLQIMKKNMHKSKYKVVTHEITRSSATLLSLRSKVHHMPKLMSIF